MTHSTGSGVSARFGRAVHWLYTPLMGRQVDAFPEPIAVVYDCMDELSKFDFASPEIPEREYRPIHPEPGWRSLARKIWAPIAVLIGLVLKFGFAFAKFASIFVAVGGYALIWGWQFGVGFVLLIVPVAAMVPVVPAILPVTAPVAIDTVTFLLTLTSSG